MSTTRVQCDLCQRVTVVDAITGPQTLSAAGWTLDGAVRCAICAPLGAPPAAPTPAPDSPEAAAPAEGGSGWSDAAASGGPAVASGAGADPDAAIRARITAAVTDLILVGVAIQSICLLFGFGLWVNGGLKASLIAVAVTFAYFVVCEAHGGQTVGKRWYGLRVVRSDGRPLDTRAVVVRNLLRLLDALPALYACGLASVMMSGSERRQRIGDRVAGTLVVSSGDKDLVSPRHWMLPTAMVVSLVFSAAVVLTLARGHRPAGPASTQGAPAAPSSSGGQPRSSPSPGGGSLPLAN